MDGQVVILKPNNEHETIINNFELHQYGVVLTFGNTSDILIPWNRIIEVWTTKGGFSK